MLVPAEVNYTTNLRDVLADLYPETDEARMLLREAEIPTQRIRFSASALTNWWAIIEEARKQGTLPLLVAAAARQYPHHAWLSAAASGVYETARGPEVRWHAQPEVIIGDTSTLLPVAWLLDGYERARAVARVVLLDGSRGSGFYIGDGLFVTNNHVLPNIDAAYAARAEFYYETGAAGKSGEGSSDKTCTCNVFPVMFNPSRGFATSAAHDCTVVALASDDVEQRVPALRITTTTPPRTGAYVQIIQHPGGGPKQIGLYHNTVTYADGDICQYLTDTMPGSSGSPVFDAAWNFVALHHSGGWQRQPGESATVYRNEGIAAGRVLEVVRMAMPEYGK